LAVSLSVIGYAACSQRTPHHAAVAQRAVAVATSDPTPATPPPPTAPAEVTTAEPSAAPASPVASPATPSPSAGAPRLAIIIDDCGQWPVTERGFIALPVALTLSVLPDVRYNKAIEREAADAGKGVILHLPMETLSGLDPGPGKVTTEMDDAAIVAQVDRDLDDVDLATGVNNHEGSKATADPRVMNAVIGELARRNRFFIDSMTNSRSVGESVAAAAHVPTAARDVFLDNRADVAYSEAQLRAAAAIARRDGSAIAIGHPRPTTLIAVREMLPELQADGIELVRVADLAH
jgi:polysaccharide deacetylase 2 family uncharacterized protein YibQ